jgi:hypothetical protein
MVSAPISWAMWAVMLRGRDSKGPPLVHVGLGGFAKTFPRRNKKILALRKSILRSKTFLCGRLNYKVKLPTRSVIIVVKPKN